jgi:acetyltransferase
MNSRDAVETRIEPFSRHALEVFFRPNSIAVIGASVDPRSVGNTVVRNLIRSSFGGKIYPVNPKHTSVLGIRCYPTVLDIPDPIDLVVVVTPAATVPEIIEQSGRKNVLGAVIISAGFRETGKAGLQLEQTVLQKARMAGVRVIGPNCLGVIAPWTGLNATFATTMPKPGHIAFISQSGALCTAILDWSMREMVGFSAFVSTGSMLDVGWGDLIDYLADDSETRSILMYMESVGDARTFLSAVRAVSLTKPVIILKAGRTPSAASAAASHTGSMVGDDAVFEAAVRRCGALRVDRLADLFSMADVLDKQPRPRGPRLTIVTNAGGPGVLATDALLREGGALAELAPETIRALNSFLPPHWSHQNPIDLIGDADTTRYSRAVQIAAQDPRTDGVLVIYAPQGIASPTEIAEGLRQLARLCDKPVLASWMGGVEAAPGGAILTRAGIPVFDYPETAARAFQYMWRYTYNLRGIYETPSHRQSSDRMDMATSSALIQKVREQGRTLLTEFESKRILEASGIPIVRTLIAANEEEAVRAAREIGYPVVLKLDSHTIAHKANVGGVELNLYNEAAVRNAFRTIEANVRERARATDFQGVTVQEMIRTGGYELILGSTTDPQFGPVIAFGAGGQLVEVFRDRALALPPLNTTLARRMMEETRIYAALRGVLGNQQVDLGALEDLIVGFSQMVVDLRLIKEIDINPLLVSRTGILALDARMVLFGDDIRQEEDLPRLAIRPYPAQYVHQSWLKDSTAIRIRPIRPEDEPEMIRFHQSLSDRTVYFRYFRLFHLSDRVAHERLAQICFIDYDRQIALVAECETGPSQRSEIVGVARLTRIQGSRDAEFAVVVSDAYQKRGVGTQLLQQLIQIARKESIGRITGDVLAENTAMQALCRKLGFTLTADFTTAVVTANMELESGDTQNVSPVSAFAPSSLPDSGIRRRPD